MLIVVYISLQFKPIGTKTAYRTPRPRNQGRGQVRALTCRSLESEALRPGLAIYAGSLQGQGPAPLETVFPLQGWAFFISRLVIAMRCLLYDIWGVTTRLDFLNGNFGLYFWRLWTFWRFLSSIRTAQRLTQAAHRTTQIPGAPCARPQQPPRRARRRNGHRRRCSSGRRHRPRHRPRPPS